jgi:predicted nucleic acid-binding protein
MAKLTAYVDSSVLLRIVLEQQNPLPEWNAIDVGVVSALVPLEVTRTLERLWLQRELSEMEMHAKAEAAGEMLNRMIVLELDQRVIDVASQSFLKPLATLDSLHLASVLLYRQAQQDDESAIVLTTHDRQLAEVARSLNLHVLGA